MLNITTKPSHHVFFWPWALYLGTLILTLCPSFLLSASTSPEGLDLSAELRLPIVSSSVRVARPGLVRELSWILSRLDSHESG